MLNNNQEHTLLIREAAEQDIEFVTHCVSQAYALYIPRIGKKPGPMLDDYNHVLKQHHMFVGVIDDELVGVLVLKEIGEGFLLDNIAVIPFAQGCGYAKELIVFAETYVRQKGCFCLELYTHEAMNENLSMYKHLGYQEFKRVTEAGYQRVYLRKQLPDFNPDAVRTLIEKSWSLKTAAQWSEQNPANGQCNVTAILLWELYGGQLLKTKVKKGFHYYNRIQGKTYDFTDSQFDSRIEYQDVPVSFREVKKPLKEGELNALRSNFQNALSRSTS